MKGVTSKTIRQIKITTPKVIDLATELVEREKAILRGKSGIIELRNHQLNRELKKFLENEGMAVEYAPTESRRGKVEIAGVRVRVMPVKHTNYDGGVLIQTMESGKNSYTNINKVLEFLSKNGILVAKECVFITENSEERACIFKSTEE